MTLLSPALAAVAVGFVLLVAGRNVYLCGAIFQLPDKLDPPQRDLCRNTLYEVVSTDREFLTSADTGPGFFVDFPTHRTLRFAFSSPKNTRAMEHAKRLAAGFLARIEQKMRRMREQPSEGELATTAHITELGSALASEQGVLQQALAEIPDVDHRAERDDLLGKWRDVRRQYNASRTRLSKVAGSLEQLRDAPPPSRGIVSAKVRRNAYSADLGLQQDLKELAVALSEARGLIRKLETETAPLRTQLNDAVAKLLEVLHAVDSEKLAKSVGDRVALLSSDASALRTTLDAFSTTWTLELTAIRKSPIEPRSQEFFDRYERARTTLGTFLFDTSKLLAQMRKSANNLDAVRRDDGRVLQFQAAVSRSFQTLQTLYHRFEFASSALDQSQNFRLDTALRRASGLRRRSQQQIRKIDDSLQRAALKQMKKSQAASLLQAEALLVEQRIENDQTVSTLVDLQDRLAKRVGSVEGFVATEARAEMATQNLETLRKTLDESKRRLRELKIQRITRGAIGKIELATTGILGPPINVGERFRNSAVGAAITFFGLLLGQWWVTRRT